MLTAKSLEHYVLADATLPNAVSYVQRLLKDDFSPSLVPYVKEMGGRLTDLNLFVTKIQAGRDPKGTE